MIHREAHRTAVTTAMSELENYVQTKLNELQVTAVRSRDIDAFEQLEQIRREMPHELGEPERDTFSFARLKGQAIVAQSNVAVAEMRVRISISPGISLSLRLMASSGRSPELTASSGSLSARSNSTEGQSLPTANANMRGTTKPNKALQHPGIQGAGGHCQREHR